MTRFGAFLLAGEAEAPALVLSIPLSFWGGIAVETGTIVDRSHPQCGIRVTGQILVMPGGRGSSSSSAVLAEVTRRKVGPRAIVLFRPDPILVVGSLVAQELYGITCPIVVMPIEGFVTGQVLRITAVQDGRALIERARIV